MAAGQDINVKINGDISLLTKSLTRAKNQIALFQTSVRPMGDSLKRMQPQFKKVATISDAVADSLTRQGKGKGNWTFMGDAIDRTTSSLTRAKQPLMSMTDAINRSKQTRRGWISDVQIMGTRAAPTATRGLQGLDGVISRTTKKMKQSKVEFAGWAMSIMFFGMALQRMFNTVWKQSTKTFQDVMHSTAGTVTGFDMLQGSLDYLKFTAGAALEPIATYLYPIIDSITDWISTNEGLFSSLVILFGILGTAFMVGGSGKLALDGFTQLSNLTFGNFDIAGKGGILALISTPVGAGVIAALIALAAVGAVAWKSFSETPEAWRAMKDAMSEAASPLSDMAKSLKILIELVFDFQVNWESVAWTIVWVTRVVGAMLKMWLAPLNAVFNAVMAIVNALLAMNSVKKLDFQAAKEYSRSAINNQDAVVDAFKDALLIPNLLNVGTPGSIKREYEAKNEQQRIDSSTSQLGNLYETAPQLHLTVQLDTDVITNEVVKKLNFMGDIIR